MSVAAEKQYDGYVKEVDEIAINHTEFVEAQHDALAEGRPQWQVIRENIKTCLVIVIVQVSQSSLACCFTLSALALDLQ